MSIQAKNDIAPFNEVASLKNFSHNKINSKADPLLNKADLRSKFALENAGVGIWEWDISTDELVWSSVMFSLYGYDSHQENISYEFWRRHVHKDDIDQTEHKIKKVLQDNIKLEMQFRIVCPDQTIKYLKCIAKIIQDDNGASSKMIGTNWDITDQVCQQKEIQKIKNELVLFFNLNADYMCIANRDGYFEKVNDAFFSKLGYTKEMIKEHKFIHFIHNDDRASSLEELKKLDLGVTIVNFTNRFKSKNGKWKWLSWAVTPDMNTGKLYATARDISSLVKLKFAQERERELKKQKEIAEEIARIGDKFISTMSHELRTPINGISGIIDFLSKEENFPEEYREHFSIMEASVDNLTVILNDILDLSKIQSGTFDLMICDTELRSIVKHVVELYRKKAEKKGLELFFICPESASIQIRSSRIRLVQVLNNLVSNAIKFTEKGSVTIIVSSLKETNHCIEYKIEVKDTGRGIHKSDHNQIFEAYGQIEQANDRSKTGTGLGLSICKKIMSLMGGQIGLDSSTNTGSNFWVTFTADKVKHQLRPSKNDVEMQLFPGFKVLVVEDNLVNQKVLDLLLTQRACNVQIVGSGNEAIEAVKKETFDLVFMDINLPGISGIEASRFIRKFKKTCPPIIGHGASGLTFYETELKEGVFDGFLNKPVQSVQLENILMNWFKNI